MSEKDVLKLFKCLFETGNMVLCRITEKKLSAAGYGKFSDFLKTEKHKMFHLVNFIPCCECRSNGITNFNGNIEKWMFEKLYDESNSALQNHVKQCGRKVTQQCLHKYKEKNVSIKELDLPIFVQIIHKFLLPTSQEKQALKQIIKIRNDICHLSYLNVIKMSQADVESTWNNLENALLDLTDSYDKDFVKSLIQLSKQCDIKEKEVNALRDSIKENAKHIEGLKNCQTNILKSFQNEVNGLNKQLSSLEIINQEMCERMEKSIAATVESCLNCFTAKFVETIGKKKIPVAFTIVGQVDKEENTKPINQSEVKSNEKRQSDEQESSQSLGYAMAMSVGEPSAIYEQDSLVNESEVKSDEKNQSDEEERSQSLGYATAISVGESSAINEQDSVVNESEVNSDEKHQSDEQESSQSLGYATAMSVGEPSAIIEQDTLVNDKGTLYMTINVKSDDFDEDSAVTILPNMKTVHWHIKSARKNCIILEIRMFPEALKDEQTFRESLHSLLQETLKAGNVDFNNPGTIQVEILVESSLTTEDEQKLKTWINSWEEKIESHARVYTEDQMKDEERYVKIYRILVLVLKPCFATFLNEKIQPQSMEEFVNASIKLQNHPSIPLAFAKSSNDLDISSLFVIATEGGLLKQGATFSKKVPGNFISRLSEIWDEIFHKQLQEKIFLAEQEYRDYMGDCLEIAGVFEELNNEKGRYIRDIKSIDEGQMDMEDNKKLMDYHKTCSVFFTPNKSDIETNWTQVIEVDQNGKIRFAKAYLIIMYVLKPAVCTFLDLKRPESLSIKQFIQSDKTLSDKPCFRKLLEKKDTKTSDLDITALGYVAKYYLKQKLTEQERRHILDLVAMRNELVHSAYPELDEQEYNKHLQEYKFKAYIFEKLNKKYGKYVKEVEQLERKTIKEEQLNEIIVRYEQYCVEVFDGILTEKMNQLRRRNEAEKENISKERQVSYTRDNAGFYAGMTEFPPAQAVLGLLGGPTGLLMDGASFVAKLFE